MQIYDRFGAELFVDDMVARVYTAYRTGEFEIVYIDKIPEAPGKMMKVRDIKINSYSGTYNVSNVKYDPTRLVKLSQEQIDAALV